MHRDEPKLAEFISESIGLNEQLLQQQEELGHKISQWRHFCELRDKITSQVVELRSKYDQNDKRVTTSCRRFLADSHGRNAQRDKSDGFGGGWARSGWRTWGRGSAPTLSLPPTHGEAPERQQSDNQLSSIFDRHS